MSSTPGITNTQFNENPVYRMNKLLTKFSKWRQIIKISSGDLKLSLLNLKNALKRKKMTKIRKTEPVSTFNCWTKICIKHPFVQKNFRIHNFPSYYKNNTDLSTNKNKQLSFPTVRKVFRKFLDITNFSVQRKGLTFYHSLYRELPGL